MESSDQQKEMTDSDPNPKWELANDKPYREGSDSGVDAPPFTRELSNNSNDYASSGIGHENETCTTSCTSSMISCSSDFPCTEDTVKATDCASEGGSESSSVHAEKADKCGPLSRRRLNFKSAPSASDKTRNSAAGLGPNLLTSERARSRDKPAVAKKPTTLPVKNATLSRSLSISAGSAASKLSKTPQTPSTDDGRWPSTSNTRAPSTLREQSITRSQSMSKGGLKCATLPRRRRDPEDLMTRSSSVSRDVMSLSMRSGRIKTRIYLESAVQTCLTGSDLERAVNAGESITVKIDSVETATKETQSDIRDRQVEALEAKIKELTAANTLLELNLQKEREERLLSQRDLRENASKILSIIEPYSTEKVNPEDGLVIVEMQLKSSEKIIRRQQDEIKRLQTACCGLHQDLDKALSATQNLTRQKNELEEESSELHEFLQAEKLAFVEALKESEVEVDNFKQKLVQKETELDSKTEECHHLVRISEQRRQEILGLQAKCYGLENRCKELLCQQGAAVSGASSALGDLATRLEQLVEQLIKSYDITNEELEAIQFDQNSPHDDDSPIASTADCLAMPKTRSEASLSPQRNQSFIAAVVNAIKNATSSAKQSVKRDTVVEDKSDSTEMLDSETEPCLMMDNVLEDVTMPDSHSHNLVSATSQLMLSHTEMPADMYRQDDSMNNLQEAIENRQHMEMQANQHHHHHRSPAHQTGNRKGSTSDDLSGNDSYIDMPSISDFCTAHALVDQVIDVDNLLTRLLKVLHIVQVNSDSCIQELLNEKEKMALNQEDGPEIQELRKELTEATSQLVQKSNELLNCKFDLQRHRLEIDKLNQDICNLSTLCSVQKEVSGEGLNIEQVTNSPGWKQAIIEAKRQYEAIDQALEILHDVQTVVEQCPALKKLQTSLEETNFHGATSIPLLNAILAASVGTNAVTAKSAVAQQDSDLNANPTERENLVLPMDGNTPIDSTA